MHSPIIQAMGILYSRYGYGCHIYSLPWNQREPAKSTPKAPGVCFTESINHWVTPYTQSGPHTELQNSNRRHHRPPNPPPVHGTDNHHGGSKAHELSYCSALVELISGDR